MCAQSRVELTRAVADNLKDEGDEGGRSLETLDASEDSVNNADGG